MAIGMGGEARRKILKKALGQADHSGNWSMRVAYMWQGSLQKALNRCGDPEYVWFVTIHGDRLCHYLKIFRQRRLKKGGLGPLQLWEVVWDKICCEHSFPLEVLHRAMRLPPFPGDANKKKRRKKRRR